MNAEDLLRELLGACNGLLEIAEHALPEPQRQGDERLSRALKARAAAADYLKLRPLLSGTGKIRRVRYAEVSCATCSQTLDLWSGETTQLMAMEARNAGWSWSKKTGWLCPGCTHHRSKEVPPQQ